MNKIDNILKKLSQHNPGRVLDIGAGDCDVPLYFFQKGSIVDAIEPNPKEGCFNDKKINLIKEKIEDYDLPENKYNLVIMRSVIHFLKPKNLFNKIFPKVEALLKNEGFLYIYTMTPPKGVNRYTHKPQDITDSLKDLILCHQEENKKDMLINDKKFEHITWKLVYQKK